MARHCHFISVNTSFTDPGKEKELKTPAATKDKGNSKTKLYKTLRSMCIEEKKSCNALAILFLQYSLVRNL